MNTERLSETLSVVLVIALLATAVWFAVRPTTVPAAFAGPSVEELDSLNHYLRPVPPAPDVENYDMFVPATDQVAYPSSPPEQVTFVPRERRLTAILVVGNSPIAIVDDQQVQTGSILPGGTEVIAIDRSEVVLREPDGSRRTLRFSATEEVVP